MKTLRTIFWVVIFAFGILSFEALAGMLLFNWVAGLFGCAFTLTFWQAFGVCALFTFVGRFFKTSSKRN